MPDLAYAMIYITETATLLGGKKQVGGVMSRNGAIFCRRELDQEILGLLESTLQLDSIACRESANKISRDLDKLGLAWYYVAHGTR